MRVLNTDALTHQTKGLRSVSMRRNEGKKKIYLEAFLQQRRYFSPFVASVYGLLGVEATAALKMLDSRLATKWK